MFNRIAQGLERLSNRIFRRRELILRSDAGVHFLVLSPTVQRWVAASAFVALVAVGLVVISQHEAWRVVAVKGEEVARVEEAYRQAIDSLGAAVEGATEAGRAESASEILNLVAQNQAMQKHLGDVQQRLASAEVERERAATVHEGLIDRMRQLDQQMRVIAGKNLAPGKNLGNDAVLSSLEQSAIDAMAERGRLAVERDRLAGERNQLNAEMSELARKQNAVAASHEATITQLNDKTKTAIDGLKRLIGRTGLDADKVLVARAPGGVGGPFIPSFGASPADKIEANLVGLGSQIGRLEEMRRLLRSLPTGAPLDNYAVMSPFGVRRDPFNGQPSMHNGVDLSAPMRTPIMATAAGIVVSAGWNGEFGNLVEVDHGYGIVTRYGYMSHIYVKVGQRVAARHVIGLVGTTGRSTGPHVHYEVMNDGKNLNPVKFLEVARYVPKSQ